MKLNHNYLVDALQHFNTGYEKPSFSPKTTRLEATSRSKSRSKTNCFIHFKQVYIMISTCVKTYDTKL